MSPVPYGCSKCGGSIPAGTTLAHCSSDGCHRTFGGIHGFDFHRIGRIDPHDPELDTRRCRTADELRDAGYEPNARGVWRKPRPADTLPDRTEGA